MTGYSRKNFACVLSVLSLLAFAAGPAFARDAAFLDPNSNMGGSANVDEALHVDPKADIDTGESVLNIARRTTLFFANQSNQPVHIESVAANSDGNVTAEITADDCSKQGTIAPTSRCTVEVSVTPTTTGPWSVQILVTHNGAGRIARAKLNGKTPSTATTEKKDAGLALNTKEVNPVTFGDVEVGTGKAVRSALMVNDSPETITLYAIDVIEADNGLQRLDQGCAIDMELKPGESCPVTLVWTPTTNGVISTDLIIRHSGRLGFAVIPIRGTAKGGQAVASSGGDTKGGKSKDDSIPAPPSMHDLDKAMAGKAIAVSSSALGAGASTSAPVSTPDNFRLIGTVGNRAVLLRPDGVTAIVAADDSIDVSGKSVKVTAVSAKAAELLIDGKKKVLTLEAAPELTSKAISLHAKSGDSASASASGSASSTGTSAPGSMTPLLPATANGGGK